MSVFGLKRERSSPPSSGRLASIRSSAAALRMRLPPLVLAYAIPSLFAAAAVQTWFTSGTVLAGGDQVPPLATDTDYAAHWSHEDGGEGAPSYTIISLPYVEGLRAAAWVGLGEPMFQRLWLTAIVAGAVAAVVYLARGIGVSPLGASVAGFVAVFNAHFLVTGFDWVPFAAMLAAALLGGMLIRAGANESPPVLLFALASLLLGPVFANPALVALVLAWLCIAVGVSIAVHGRQALRRCGVFVARAAPFAVLFNLWWLVPALQTITSDVFGERFAAPGSDDWSWTHARASLVNVLGLTSHWAWPRAEYFPFAADLEHGRFSLLQFVPVVAAALGILLAGRRHRRVALLLGAFGAVAVWVMKGVHQPFGGTNRWLYETIPGLWLLRDPAKVGFVLVLILSLLTAIAISQLARRSRLLGSAAAVLVVAGALAYAHPFLSGEVVPDDRPLLPSAHVRIPDSWRAAADFVDDAPKPGKVLVLPQLDYYQAPTTWGYYGASFLHRLIERPVVEIRPGGYYENQAVAELVRSLETDLLAGRSTAAPFLQALGVRFVLVRHDLDTSFPDRSLTDPAVLARRLRGVPTLRHVRSFGFVDVYEAHSIDSAEVYAAVPFSQGARDLHARPRLLAAAEGTAGIPGSAVLDGVASARLGIVPIAPDAQRVQVTATPGGTAVRLEPLHRPSDGRGRLLQFPGVGTPFQLIAGDAHVSVTQRPQTMVVVPANGRREATIESVRQIQLDPDVVRRVGDCNRYDERGLRAVGIAARLDESATPTLRLRARDHSACVALPIPSGDQPGRFRLQLDYRGVHGEPPRICLWQEGPDRCAPLPSLEASPGWHRLDATVKPRSDAESTRLFLYADGARGRLTEAAYRAIQIAPVGEDTVIGVVPSSPLPKISYRRTAPSTFRIRVREARAPFLLVMAESYAPGWTIEREGLSDTDTVHVRVNGYANGWRIPWTGSYELTATYEPERLAELALYVDLVAVPLGLGALILWRRRRR